jgi:hypothetical protein
MFGLSINADDANQYPHIRNVRTLLNEVASVRVPELEARFETLYPGLGITVHLLVDGRAAMVGIVHAGVFDSIEQLQDRLTLWERMQNPPTPEQSSTTTINQLIARDIVFARWTVYWYSDEEHIDSASFTTSDGTTRQSDSAYGSADMELEHGLWQISMRFGYGGNTGIYTLDVPTRTVTRIGDAVFHYSEEYEAGGDDEDEEEGDEGNESEMDEEKEDDSWMELTELPLEQHRTVTI